MAETTLLIMKKKAIAALPENLKATTLFLDLTKFHANRFEGYLEKFMEVGKKTSRKEKLILFPDKRGTCPINMPQGPQHAKDVSYYHRLLHTKSGNYSSTFVYMNW